MQLTAQIAKRKRSLHVIEKGKKESREIKDESG